jgi:hypothetical protein
VLTEKEAMMKRLVVVPTAILFILTTSATAGPEKVAFPAYQTHVLYTVLDQPDIKELREGYITRKLSRPSSQVSPCRMGQSSACRLSRRC